MCDMQKMPSREDASCEEDSDMNFATFSAVGNAGPHFVTTGGQLSVAKLQQNVANNGNPMQPMCVAMGDGGVQYVRALDGSAALQAAPQLITVPIALQGAKPGDPQPTVQIQVLNPNLLQAQQQPKYQMQIPIQGFQQGGAVLTVAYSPEANEQGGLQLVGQGSLGEGLQVLAALPQEMQLVQPTQEKDQMHNMPQVFITPNHQIIINAPDNKTLNNNTTSDNNNMDVVVIKEECDELNNDDESSQGTEASDGTQPWQLHSNQQQDLLKYISTLPPQQTQCLPVSLQQFLRLNHTEIKKTEPVEIEIEMKGFNQEKTDEAAGDAVLSEGINIEIRSKRQTGERDLEVDKNILIEKSNESMVDNVPQATESHEQVKYHPLGINTINSQNKSVIVPNPVHNIVEQPDEFHSPTSNEKQEVVKPPFEYPSTLNPDFETIDSESEVEAVTDIENNDETFQNSPEHSLDCYTFHSINDNVVATNSSNDLFDTLPIIDRESQSNRTLVTEPSYEVSEPLDLRKHQRNESQNNNAQIHDLEYEVAQAMEEHLPLSKAECQRIEQQNDVNMESNPAYDSNVPMVQNSTMASPNYQNTNMQNNADMTNRAREAIVPMEQYLQMTNPQFQSTELPNVHANVQNYPYELIPSVKGNFWLRSRHSERKSVQLQNDANVEANSTRGTVVTEQYSRTASSDVEIEPYDVAVPPAGYYTMICPTCEGNELENDAGVTNNLDYDVVGPTCIPRTTPDYQSNEPRSTSYDVAAPRTTKENYSNPQDQCVAISTSPEFQMTERQSNVDVNTDSHAVGKLTKEYCTVVCPICKRTGIQYIVEIVQEPNTTTASNTQNYPGTSLQHQSIDPKYNADVEIDTSDVAAPMATCYSEERPEYVSNELKNDGHIEINPVRLSVESTDEYISVTCPTCMTKLQDTSFKVVEHMEECLKITEQSESKNDEAIDTNSLCNFAQSQKRTQTDRDIETTELPKVPLIMKNGSSDTKSQGQYNPFRPWISPEQNKTILAANPHNAIITQDTQITTLLPKDPLRKGIEPQEEYRPTTDLKYGTNLHTKILKEYSPMVKQKFETMKRITNSVERKQAHETGAPLERNNNILMIDSEYKTSGTEYEIDAKHLSENGTIVSHWETDPVHDTIGPPEDLPMSKPNNEFSISIYENVDMREKVERVQSSRKQIIISSVDSVDENPLLEENLPTSDLKFEKMDSIHESVVRSDPSVNPEFENGSANATLESLKRDSDNEPIDSLHETDAEAPHETSKSLEENLSSTDIQSIDQQEKSVSAKTRAYEAFKPLEENFSMNFDSIKQPKKTLSENMTLEASKGLKDEFAKLLEQMYLSIGLGSSTSPLSEPSDEDDSLSMSESDYEPMDSQNKETVPAALPANEVKSCEENSDKTVPLINQITAAHIPIPNCALTSDSKTIVACGTVELKKGNDLTTDVELKSLKSQNETMPASNHAWLNIEALNEYLPMIYSKFQNKTERAANLAYDTIIKSIKEAISMKIAGVETLEKYLPESNSDSQIQTVTTITRENEREDLGEYTTMICPKRDETSDEDNDIPVHVIIKSHEKQSPLTLPVTKPEQQMNEYIQIAKENVTVISEHSSDKKVKQNLLTKPEHEPTKQSRLIPLSNRVFKIVSPSEAVKVTKPAHKIIDDLKKSGVLIQPVSVSGKNISIAKPELQPTNKSNERLKTASQSGAVKPPKTVENIIDDLKKHNVTIQHVKSNVTMFKNNLFMPENQPVNQSKVICVTNLNEGLKIVSQSEAAKVTKPVYHICDLPKKHIPTKNQMYKTVGLVKENVLMNLKKCNTAGNNILMIKNEHQPQAMLVAMPTNITSEEAHKLHPILNNAYVNDCQQHFVPVTNDINPNTSTAAINNEVPIIYNIIAEPKVTVTNTIQPTDKIIIEQPKVSNKIEQSAISTNIEQLFVNNDNIEKSNVYKIIGQRVLNMDGEQPTVNVNSERPMKRPRVGEKWMRYKKKAKRAKRHHTNHEQCRGLVKETNVIYGTIRIPSKKKKKYKKKPPKPARPKPGQVVISTAVDGSPLFCCPECQMAYPEKEQLEIHLVTHKVERRFICGICGAGLKRKEHLERHKLGHNPERPYVCGVCRKGFKRREHLNLHTVIHSGVKTEMCTECGKGFYRKDHLRKHTRSHESKRARDEAAGEAAAPHNMAPPNIAPAPAINNSAVMPEITIHIPTSSNSQMPPVQISIPQHVVTSLAANQQHDNTLDALLAHHS